VSKVSVNLNAAVQPDGSVVCALECDGQEAKITFTGTDVLFDVPEPAQAGPAAGGAIEDPGSYIAGGGVPIPQDDPPPGQPYVSPEPIHGPEPLRGRE
jgi:hypothetical protein